MSYFDYFNLPDDHYERLDPLVPVAPAGIDPAELRQTKLQEVIEGWLNSESLIGEDSSVDFDTLELHSSALKKVDLRDDNPGASPIDLGKELLRPLLERIAQEDPNRKIVVALLGCNISTVNAANLDLQNVRITLSGCKINQANFIGARFGEQANFRGARFGEQANFSGARFDEQADFSGARFDEQANFRGARFDEQANFRGARFGEQATPRVEIW